MEARTKEDLKATLDGMVEGDGSLSLLYPYVDWSKRMDKVYLDGEFTAEELCAIGEWVKMHKP